MVVRAQMACGLEIAAAVCLAGCATQGELRRDAAAERLESSRPPDAVRDCLSDGLGRVRQFGLPVGAPSVTPYRGGWTLSFTSRGSRPFIDVTPREGGSLVVFHPGLPMDVPASVGRAVRACSGAA